MSRLLPFVFVGLALLLGSSGCRQKTEAGPEAGGATPEEPSADVEQLQAEARALTEEFQTQLKAELLGAIQGEGGSPAKAIGVCQDEAPEIAKRVSEQGWTVARTAPRVRNPDNAPNEWQQRGLAHFGEAIAQAGDNPTIAELEWHEVQQGPEGARFVYMRAIPMGGLCLACHGPVEQIDEAVLEQLATHYPKDEATGFEVGELRGAFVVTRKL